MSIYQEPRFLFKQGNGPTAQIVGGAELEVIATQDYSAIPVHTLMLETRPRDEHSRKMPAYVGLSLPAAFVGVPIR